ncbi:MAG: signal peptidase II [Lachnospiraceae bacterium]|nr:signal peptidase II [Lachnospiraceae bacterium]MBQ7781274.1 signal peptidase II [Lachnospiraceae bacterium]
MLKNKTKLKWLAIFFALTVLSIVLDQVTKLLAIKNLQGKGAYPLIDGVLELQFFSNTGIAWSMLEGQSIFILFMGIIFLAVILFFIIKLPDAKKYHILYILGGLLTGGAIGNMIDRFRLGYVVDFISFVLIHFPIFNMADMCIVVSVILFAVMFIFIYKEEDLAFLNFKQKKYREVKEEQISDEK